MSRERETDPRELFRERPRRVPLGRVLITPGARDLLLEDEVRNALAQHERCDWGEVDQEDWAANDQALENGARVLSAHRTLLGDSFWIITEADRSATTILLPEEY